MLRVREDLINQTNVDKPETRSGNMFTVPPKWFMQNFAHAKKTTIVKEGFVYVRRIIVWVFLIDNVEYI